ncbi:hypothetical protein N7509_011794 [Penicillium cosmopolitanum]|uniref:DUF6594 domain-containing protein n=1 Tax=Penicillium cosmopolitanum TaxID=1131564 RepID=A0A9W9SIL8_9EURO|nr:uncharacterized protein N7509_011794 [Penicillium cosmopolitanum]KAJ5378675.1 hypothetical protein N7509_011794 [Penicillium cosmopolitanum]
MSSIIDMTRLSKSEETLGNGISDTRIKGYPKGYPELAAFMESDPGFGILRRFNHLHLRNLLYMQEELTSMDRRLYEIDASETDELNNMTRPGDENVDRKVLMTEIRVKLREYGTVLPR